MQHQQHRHQQQQQLQQQHKQQLQHQQQHRHHQQQQLQQQHKQQLQHQQHHPQQQQQLQQQHKQQLQHQQHHRHHQQQLQQQHKQQLQHQQHHRRQQQQLQQQHHHHQQQQNLDPIFSSETQTTTVGVSNLSGCSPEVVKPTNPSRLIDRTTIRYTFTLDSAYNLFLRYSSHQIKKIFSHFDVNGDQRISRYEILRAMRCMGIHPTNDEFDKMMQPVDEDKDGYVSFSEFEKVMMRSISLQEYEGKVLRDSFKMFDLDGDGYISKDELKQILTAAGDKMAEQKAEELLLEADTNNDGKISYDEFVATICK
ncbi:myb-like protein Q [Ylistrum balloti]|uniref:myb-like protein Q n=1 Tax=Ylistrum balloti TaxID=509963 RepID=UPI0029057F3E|nr:myb-like protein Q [Ylistrum balloti]